MLKLRLAAPDDTDIAVNIIEDARKYLGSQGLPQWQDGHGPNRSVLEEDARRSLGYVLEEDGVIRGYAAMQAEVHEPYERLTNGTWEGNHDSYIVIHRVALDPAVRGRGLAVQLLTMLTQEALRLGYRDIRVDTHAGNVIMHKAITRAGFVQRGDIMMNIPNGERVAYQLLLQ